MNLDQAFNAPGNWIVMRGTPTEYNYKPQGDWGPYATGKFRDDNGAEVTMMFSAKKGQKFPSQNMLNIPTIWAVKYDANSQRYSAKWHSYASQEGQLQQAPGQYGAPQAQQRPQTAQQAANTAKEIERLSMERMSVQRGVLSSPSCPKDLGLVIKWCCTIHKWVETGQDIPVMTGNELQYENAPQEGSSDDIPW